MKSKRIFTKIVLAAIFLVQILPRTVFSQDFNQSNIKIVITPLRGKTASATFTQGESVFFKVEFKQINPLFNFRRDGDIVISANLIKATFTSPNGQINVRLERSVKGFYYYESPILGQTGVKNHTLTVTVLAVQKINIFPLDPKIVSKASCSISVVPLTIRITSPANNSIVNTNLITGTVNTEIAEVPISVNNTIVITRNGRFTINGLLQEGQNTITAYATIQGQRINAQSIVVILDTISPEIVITNPSNGLNTNQAQVNVTGTVTDLNLITDTVTVNGIRATVTGNIFTAEGIPLPNEGANTIIVIARDRAGNESSRQINVVKDTRPPQVQNITINEGNSTRNRLIHITFQVDDVDQMKISEDSDFTNTAWEAFVITKEFTLSEGLGEKDIFFKFKDQTGNETGIISRNISLVGLAKPVSQGPVKILDRQLFVNDEPYIIKGITYQPTPIQFTAEDPYYLAYSIYTSRNCGRDFPLLRDMGCNTIRIYNGAVVESSDMLNMLYMAWNGGINPIMVCAGFWVGYDEDFTDQLTRFRLVNEFRSYVRDYKDKPAILIWVIGNEQNAHNGNNSHWYSLADEMARAAYEEEGANYHPVAIVNGELNNIGDAFMLADDNSLNYIDIWAINVYAGYSFTDNPNYPNYFNEYSQRSSKPLYISEYGIDAYDNVHDIESQKRQAAWDSHAWDEIAQRSDICIGATLMSYSDEWWKDPNNPLRDNRTHNNGGFFTNNIPHPDCAPDRFLNEEWWGICAVSENYPNPDNVTPRLVYFTLKKKWSNQQNSCLVDDYNDGQDPNLLGGSSNVFYSNNPGDICSYDYTNEDRQYLAVSYSVDNENSYAGYYTLLNGLDARPYNNISFWINGQNGEEMVKIGIRDRSGNEAKINISEYLPQGIANSWQKVIIPLASFGNNVDLASLDNVSLSFEYAIGSGRGTVYIDDIEFGFDSPSLIVTNFNSSEYYDHGQNAFGVRPWTHLEGNSQISYEFNPAYGEDNTAGIGISYAVRGGTYCRLGMGLCGIDASSYEKLKLSVKGAEGIQKFHLYLEDYRHNRDFIAVENITTDWQMIEIPLHSFIFKNIDITNLINLEIVFEWEDRSGTIYLDNIEFTNQ